MTARSTTSRSRIARPGALAAGAVLLTACLVGCEGGGPGSATGGGGKGLSSVEEQAAGMVAGAALVDPPDLNTATPPEMTVRLTTAQQEVEISGKKVLAETYNGSLVGPTLRVVPGQRVTLQLKNDLGTSTNLHFHGMHLSPEGNADNIFLSGKPGQTLTYQLDIPANQPAGTYWYHDHDMCPKNGQSMPGMTMTGGAAGGRCDGTESQIGAGLSGTIIVGDTRDSLPPAYRGIATHTLALKDAQINGSSSIVYADGLLEPASATVRLVNGQYQPTLTMAAGETQLWRVANIGYAIFYDLQLDGASFTIVNQDGTPSAAPAQVNHLLMPPGRRFDVLVTAGAPGSTTLRTLAYSNGGQTADQYPDTTLMKVDVQQGGGAAGGPAGMTASPQVAGPLPGSLPDLSAEPVARSRNVVLHDDGGNNFYLNGKLYDMTPTFTEPAVLGTVEEWTLTNTSGQNHPFHLHTAPFQVLSVNDTAQPASDYLDGVTVPYAVNGVAGKVVIRVRYTDFTGQWMFHCHITGHEDNGMMGSLNVIAAG